MQAQVRFSERPVFAGGGRWLWLQMVGILGHHPRRSVFLQTRQYRLHALMRPLLWLSVAHKLQQQETVSCQRRGPSTRTQQLPCSRHCPYTTKTGGSCDGFPALRNNETSVGCLQELPPSLSGSVKALQGWNCWDRVQWGARHWGRHRSTGHWNQRQPWSDWVSMGDKPQTLGDTSTPPLLSAVVLPLHVHWQISSWMSHTVLPFLVFFSRFVARMRTDWMLALCYLVKAGVVLWRAVGRPNC